MSLVLSGRVQKENGGSSKGETGFSLLSGCVAGPEFIGFHTRIRVVAPSVGEGGRAAAKGLRGPARVAARPRPALATRRAQDHPPAGPRGSCAPSQYRKIAFSFCSRNNSHFEPPPTLMSLVLAEAGNTCNIKFCAVASRRRVRTAPARN